MIFRTLYAGNYRLRLALPGLWRQQMANTELRCTTHPQRALILRRNLPLKAWKLIAEPDYFRRLFVAAAGDAELGTKLQR